MSPDAEGRRRAAAATPLRVSWFELFYDLVIVASFAHSGHLIVGDLNGDRLTMTLGAWLICTFVVTFALWFSTTTAINIAPGEVSLRKTLIFGQMIAVTIANLALSRSDGLPDDWGFAGLALAFATVTAIYALTWRQRPQLRSAVAPWMWSSAAAVALCCVGIAIPDDADAIEIVVFALAIGCIVGTITLVGIPRLCRLGLVEPEHLAERVGQLVIIVIGESFLSLVLSLNGLDYIPGPVFFFLTFFVAGSLWAIYFTSVFPMGIPLTAGRWELWLLGVVVFLVGVSFLSEMLAAYTAMPWTQLQIPRMFTPLTALYVLVGALLLGWVGGSRRDVAYARIHLGALALLGVGWIAIVRAGSSTGLLLVLSALVVIADGLACIALRRRRGEKATTLG